MENFKHLTEKVKYEKLTSDKMLILAWGIDYFLIKGIRFQNENKLELLLDSGMVPSAIQQAEECVNLWNKRTQTEKELVLMHLDVHGTAMSKIVYHGLQCTSWDFDSTLDKDHNDTFRIKICFDYAARTVEY
jgi:hypothetical protein